MTPQEQAQYRQILAGLAKSSAGLNSLAKGTPYSGATGTAANTFGGASNAAGIYSGIEQGGVGGYGSAGVNAAQLAGRTGALGASNSAANTGVGEAANALGVYNGVKQGGVSGYGGAGVNAAQLGARAGLFGDASGTVGQVAGYAAAPLAVYNAVKNWKSGATGSDALQGAEAGAAVGSIIPGVGTIIGGIVGGLIGAGSSALGGGRQDTETSNWQSYVPQANGNSALSQMLSPSQNFQNLAGVMDAKNNTAGHSQPIEQVFGREGEGNLVTQMGDQINAAAQSGAIGANDDADTIYSKVVAPWLQSKGASVADQNTAKGDPESSALTSTLKNLTSQYVGGQITPTTQLGIEGQTNSALKPFAGFSGLGSQSEIDQTNALTQSLGRDKPRNIVNPNAGGWTIAGAQPAPVSTPAPNMSTMPVNAPWSSGHAEGGYMRKRKRFDDGGDVSSDFSDYNPGGATDFNSIMSGGSGNDQTDLSNYLGGDTQAGLDKSQLALNDLGYSMDQYEAANGLNGSGGKSSNSALQAALASLKGKTTGQQGVSGYLQILSGLMPIIGALTSSKTNTSAPGAVPGMTQGASPPPAPQFSRTQVAAPSNNAGGTPMSQQDWYSYGSRPEASFFQNNQVPLVSSTKVGQAKGGALSHLKDQEQPADFGMPEFDSAVQHHVNGPGDGTSDDIPAKLSDGEYVMDANTVSMLGNGSNKAGAAQLDNLRTNLRKHAAKSMTKGKQFMKAKAPAAYMRGGSK